MERTFQIGEIAEFFHIQPSTLRFWEDCGVLIPRKNPENHYREYTIPDLLTISDILFYKSLGISLKQIQEMEQLELPSHHALCEQQMHALRRQQKILEQRLEKLNYHMAAIEMAQKLREQPYREEPIDTDCIVSFELIDIEKLEQYIENPYLYARVQHTDHINTERRGLSVNAKQRAAAQYHEILWEDHGGSYVTCLLREEVLPGYPNDLAIHLAKVRERGQTGDVISRFLTCAQEDGKIYNFYKTFIEVQ